MARFQMVSSKRVLRTPIFEVAQEHAVLSNGVEIRRKIVKHPGAVTVLVRNEQGGVLLVRQFRLPLRQRLWELPAGKRNRGESALRAAKRELAEETGYRARSWRKVLEFYPSPGFCDERITAYVARQLAAGDASPEPYELIQKRWFSWKEVMTMVDRRTICDGKTLATLLYLDRASRLGRME